MTVEASLVDRRVFLNPFADRRRRNRGENPPPGKPFIEIQSSQPEPPHRGFNFTRREAIPIIGGTVVTIGVIAGGIIRPWELFFPTDERKRADWLTLDPKERINRLELKQYPNFTDFSSETELINACAQFYCRALRCSPSALTTKVLFVDTPRILEEIEFDNQRKLTEEEREEHGSKTTEMVSDSRGLILINKDNLQREANKFLEQNRNNKEIEGRDAYTIFLKSVLFHAFSHANVSKEEITFNDITVLGQTPTIYNRLGSGFVFLGKSADGSQLFQNGGDEALTDYLGTVIGQETGTYVAGSAYKSGVRLVEMLNLRANIPIVEFIDYYTGRRPKKELFRRWGAIKNPTQPDEQAALAVLLTIGLRVNNPEDITQDQAVSKVNQLLGVR